MTWVGFVSFYAHWQAWLHTKCINTPQNINACIEICHFSYSTWNYLQFKPIPSILGQFAKKCHGIAESDVWYDMSRFWQFLCSLASLTPYQMHQYSTKYQCMYRDMSFFVFYMELPSIQAHPQHSRSICLEMPWDRRGTVSIKATEIDVFLENLMFFAH